MHSLAEEVPQVQYLAVYVTTESVLLWTRAVHSVHAVFMAAQIHI